MNIKNMRKVNAGKTVAFFSVEWPGKMTVNDMKLIQGAKGIFAATPSRKYTDKNTNQEKWTPIVYLEQDLLQKVSAAAEAEYQKLSGTNSQQPTVNDDIPF